MIGLPEILRCEEVFHSACTSLEAILLPVTVRPSSDLAYLSRNVAPHHVAPK
jgi:hypothetical protein